MREKNGITLVSLVITVIILLILAGTAITIGINESNIFEKANRAKEETNIKVSDEEKALNNRFGMLDELTAEAVTVTTDIEEYPNGWEAEKLSGIATTGLRTAPIPKGFVTSEIEGENTIAGGLVIYQTGNTVITENFWTDVDENNNELLNCQTKYNQYVWIPVEDINKMVMCKDNNKNNDGTECNLVLQSDGSLKCMTHHKNDDETELCGRIYEVVATSEIVDDKTIEKKYADFNSMNQKWNTNGNHEPDVLTDTTNGDTSTNGLAAIEEIINGRNMTWEEELKNNFKEMAESTAKYGGFYIGRYEAGYDASSYTSCKGQNVMNASNEENKGVKGWYGLYKHIKGTKEEAKSSMIWGCQYDQVIKFIGTEAQEGHIDRELPRIRNVASGITTKDKMKNIYDLEGNYWEWSALSYRDTSRSGGGGNYFRVNFNTFRPASHRGSDDPLSLDSDYGSRATLYI